MPSHNPKVHLDVTFTQQLPTKFEKSSTLAEYNSCDAHIMCKAYVKDTVLIWNNRYARVMEGIRHKQQRQARMSIIKSIHYLRREFFSQLPRFAYSQYSTEY